MNRMQRIGGIAAIFQAAAYAFGIAVAFSALAAYMTGALDRAETVAFIADNQALLYVWNGVIYIAFGVALVVLVLALHRRLGEASRGLVQTATTFGLIWAGLVLASGMIFNVGTSVVVDLLPSDPDAAASTWLAVAAVQDGLGGGNELVGGLWTLLVSWVALRTGVFAKAMNILGIVAGVAGVVTILPGLAEVGIVFGLGQLVWFAWLGVAMLVDRAPVEGRARTAVARPETRTRS